MDDTDDMLQDDRFVLDVHLGYTVVLGYQFLDQCVGNRDIVRIDHDVHNDQHNFLNRLVLLPFIHRLQEHIQ